MAKKGKVFNSLKRPKLLRKHIPAGEAAVGVLLLVIIGLMGLWVKEQDDSFDPAERDVSIQVLRDHAVADTLYRTPLEHWRDPALQGVASTAVDIAPFPPAVLGEGWRAVSRPERYDDSTLYEKINGQAEQYRKFGFRELHVVSLEKPDEELEVDVFLYEQADLANALGLYEEQRGGRGVDELGPARFTPNPLGAIGMVGRFVVHVIGSQEAVSLGEQTRTIFRSLGRSLDQAPLPLGFDVLSSELGLEFARIGYTSKNVFQLDFARDFWFGGLDESGDVRCFVHEDESAQSAEALAKRIVEDQAEELELIDSQPGWMLCRHRFLKTWFSVGYLEHMVYGVENHADRSALEAAMVRLEEAIAPSDEEGY